MKILWEHKKHKEKHEIDYRHNHKQDYINHYEGTDEEGTPVVLIVIFIFVCAIAVGLTLIIIKMI